MAQNGTNSCVEPGRQLVAVTAPSGGTRLTGQRPMATFLTHLIVQDAPGAGSSRLERTRMASARYRDQANRLA